MRGIWFESTRKRWRVRLYKNHTTYLGGYYPTRAEAERAHAELKDKLDAIPKQKRREKQPGPVPTVGSIISMLQAAQNK